MSDTDAIFREQMRNLGRKGGAATKRRQRHDPLYYKQIGRMGGRASAIARRDRIVQASRDNWLGPYEVAPTPVDDPGTTPPRVRTEGATPRKRSVYDIVDELDSYSGSKERPNR